MDERWHSGILRAFTSAFWIPAEAPDVLIACGTGNHVGMFLGGVQRYYNEDFPGADSANIHRDGNSDREFVRVSDGDKSSSSEHCSESSVSKKKLRSETSFLGMLTIMPIL